MTHSGQLEARRTEESDAVFSTFDASSVVRWDAWIDEGETDGSLRAKLDLNAHALTIAVGADTLMESSSRHLIELDAAVLDWSTGQTGQMVPYLDGLVKTRSAGRRVSWTANEPTLLELRISLLVAAHLATQTFVQSWARNLAAPDHWPSHQIVLAKRDRDSVAEAIQSAQEMAEALRNSGPKLLAAGGIAARLRRFQQALTATSVLSGPDVTFLADLAWHALSFGTATYPTVPELAMLLSLTADRGPRRRLEPSLLVPPWTIPRQIDLVKARLERGFDPQENNTARAKLLRAIASALVANGDASIKPAVAVSSCLDLELERALQRHGKPYAVTFPVAQEASDGTCVVRWLLGAFQQGSTYDSPTTWKWLDHVGPTDVRGPLVIKLNGSPLHQLPRFVTGRGAAVGSEPDLSHALVLSEATVVHLFREEYRQRERLQAQTAGSEGPIGGYLQVLNEQLTRGRSWLMIGQRTTDLAERMSIFAQVMRRPGSGNRVTMIARSFDPPRLGALWSLQPKLVEVERYDALAQLLLDYADELGP